MRHEIYVPLTARLYSTFTFTFTFLPLLRSQCYR